MTPTQAIGLGLLCQDKKGWIEGIDRQCIDLWLVYAASDPNEPKMRGLIPRFAKVQDALKSVGYKEADNFPQIVVVGVQSSGKSSVLEMIVGAEFLPK